MYIKLTDGVPVPYAIRDLHRDNPSTSFPDAMSDERLAEWGVYPVTPTPRPDYDATTQTLSEALPQQIDGAWVQMWTLTDVTPEEIEARLAEWRRGVAVTPLQMRRVLLQQGLLNGVEAFVQSADLETQMAWEYAVQIDRNNALIAAAAGALGKTDAEVDDLFRLAASY